MIPALKEYIVQYKNLNDVKDHIQVLEAQRLEQQQLLDALMPWIEEKAAILQESNNFFQKVFGKRESELDRIRDEHHRQTLRARELQEKIDLIDYQKKVLKEKLVQIPSIRYKIDKLVEETSLDSVDKKTRATLEGIRQANEYIRQNKETRMQVVVALNIGLEVLEFTRQMMQNITSMGNAPQFDPIQGITDNNFFPAQKYKRETRELIPKIGRAIRRWDKQIAEIQYHPKPKEVLDDTLHESFFRRAINNHYDWFVPTDAITHLRYALEKFQKHQNKLKKTLKSLEDEKQSFDQRKHELMLGEL